MNGTNDELESPPASSGDRATFLAAFEKLERAFDLTEQAIKECPRLKTLQLDPLLRSLAEGLRFLAANDSELELPALMLKHEWFVGQRFYVRVVSQLSPQPIFVVLPQQDIPEGVRIAAKAPRRMPVRDGEQLALDLQITRSSRKVSWHIRAIDRE